VSLCQYVSEFNHTITSRELNPKLWRLLPKNRRKLLEACSWWLCAQILARSNGLTSYTS
jgi:hypothetical protein